MLNTISTSAKDSLRVVTLCYRYAYLRNRDDALNRAERIIWAMLQSTLEGDPERQRRAHRRIALEARASLRLRGIDVPVTICDISGGGMYIQSDVRLPAGSRIEVRVGQRTETEYIFACTVARHDARGLGLRFNGAPLELRRGLGTGPAVRAA